MKIFILALFFIAAQAKTFNISDCILLEIDGTITLDVSSKIKNDSVPFNITDATVKEGSSCTELVLTLKDSVEFKLLFVPDNSSWTVQPSLSYDADKAFTHLNLTKPINVSTVGDSVGNFTKNESFLCRASVEHKFKDISEENYTFSAVATIFNLHVEAGRIGNDSFRGGTDCDQDKTTPLTPTTSGSTPTSSPKQNTPKTSFPTMSVNCSSDNVTRLLFEAQLSFDITYENEKVNITQTFNVPADAKSELNCTNNMNATISFQFNKDRVLEYIIELAKDVYWDSNVTFTYKHGEQYFHGEAINKTETLRYSSSDFLKAKVDGYYRCDSNSSINLGTNVKLYTKNLKYRAFNADNKNADLKSGNVSECSADEETSSVVPIAVGAALAALVIMFLIAYLIGRKRSCKQGYESV
ncbi:lysosome-associated membrane glycoprotein 1-like [Physella acuta]|uniref:lysosome-associated membrane glycoprotein 1-like n=1 Tax=Physella acuta TaxID=109671 RepID=UPI0027DDBFC1|nr:lysosome-associated membrane glycoprotein 1-like [Physella acuta]